MIRFAVLAALVTACDKADSAGGGFDGGGGFPPMPVEVVAAVEDTVVDALLATGQIEAIQSIDLRPEVDGRIVEILVREGATVSEGTPLIRIDDAELKAQVARAAADRDLAAQDLARARQLKQTDAIAAAEVDRAEASARSTTAQYDLLKLRLDRTIVRAPFSGVVGQRFVSLGDYVTTQSPLLALQTVHPQRAVFNVPERFAERLGMGQRVTFRTAALTGKEFVGRVDFVDPVVNQTSRTITVKAEVPNPRRDLQAGMFVELRLATETRPAAVIIPESAVVPSEGGSSVWVVAEGKAERRSVDLGVRTPGLVEVRAGVRAGEQVVVGGQERLAPGAPVMPQVKDPNAPPAQREPGAGTGAPAGPPADTTTQGDSAR